MIADFANNRPRVFLICAALILLIWSVFGQTLHFQFVNYDDDSYVYRNPHITGGLTSSSIHWAFTARHADNWHPLTTLSHLVDWQLYRDRAGGHHFTNVLLHTIATILLFLALNRLTAALWRSAIVAALFAIHPLHVESVAWVSERKDVLSAVFFASTLLAYFRYVRSNTPIFARNYAVVATLFGLGLLCKPTLVSVPFVLLLLDYWPLGRVELDAAGRPDWLRLRALLIEKVPLFVLSAAFCAATVWAQRNALDLIPKLSWPYRVGNAITSYLTYLIETVYPKDLAVLYPYQIGNVTIFRVTLALAILLFISWYVVKCRRQRPYLFVGWFWYLGVLVPMNGIVQVGIQSHADRYTYLSSIGLFILMVWSAADAVDKWGIRYRGRIAAVATVLIALVMVARLQASYWRDSERLWSHAVACTTGNYLAHEDLAIVLMEAGHADDAVAHLNKALEIKPDYADAENNLGTVFFARGDFDQATAHYRAALDMNPRQEAACYNLGNISRTLGDREQAIAYYEHATEINPNYVEAETNLGGVLLESGRTDEALRHFRRAIAIDPTHARAAGNLALALVAKGDTKDAINCWRKALAVQPSDPSLRNDLAVTLLRTGHADEAVSQWQQILHYHPDNRDARVSIAWIRATSPETRLRDGRAALALALRARDMAKADNPVVLRTLAAAYAECGRFSEAVQTADQGLQAARSGGDPKLIEKLTSELALYRSNSPLRETVR